MRSQLELTLETTGPTHRRREVLETRSVRVSSKGRRERPSGKILRLRFRLSRRDLKMRSLRLVSYTTSTKTLR